MNSARVRTLSTGLTTSTAGASATMPMPEKSFTLSYGKEGSTHGLIECTELVIMMV